MGAPLMMAAAPGEASRGLRLEERAPSITTLIVDALKASMTTSSGPVCTGPTEAPSVVPAMPAGAVPAKFSGFAPETDAPRPPASPFASAATADVQASAERSHADPVHDACFPAPRPASNAGAAPRNYSSNSLPGSWSQHDDGHDRSSNIDGLSLPLSAHTLLPQPLAPLAALTQQRLHALLPSVVARVMPELLPALLPSALEAAIASASAVTSTDGPDAASVPAMLEAAVPAALAAVLPKALTATLASLIHYATAGASSPSTFSGEAAAVLGGERQTSLDQQGAAELQLVRLLFGAEGGDVAQQQEAQRVISQGAPKALNLAELPAAPSSVHSGDSPVGAGAASAAGSGPHSPVNQPASRSSSSTAAAAAAAAAHQPAAAHLSPLSPAGAAARCLAPPPANGQSNHHNHHAQPHASASFHARASHHSHSHSHLGGPSQHLLGGEDAMSSVEDALSTCSNDATPSPYGEHGGGGSNGGTGAAVNSSANSFLMDSQALSANSVTGTLVPGLTGVDPLGIGADSAADMAAAAGMYGFNRDALYDRLQQLQGQPGAGGAATPAELLMAAASGRAMAAGGGGQGQQAAAAAAQLYAAQQAQHAQQHAQQQAQQAQQLQQLQQLQALVAGRQSGCLLPTGGLSEDLGPTSPNTGPGMPTWRRTSGTTGAELGLGHWTLGSSEADAVNLAAASLALNQQQQAQAQAAAAGLLHQQQAQAQHQQYLAQSLAAVAAANAAGAFNGAGGLQLAAAAGLGGAAGLPANVAADLATYMDAALRRMLLVSPQVAAELARACGAFSGAHAQLHHLCCVIAEQLLDVAAMAPEVAAALLRALAAHRARGAQATDVDPRVMGRILQLLRAGPAGRQLCLVSLEQWVDGLSRIHKRRAYLDTILHNYQLTLKRLVQAMGHQVHAVNMALPRQLLNDLSPRALLLLTAELAPYPLLQPRRWSEEIIWTVSQMHSMGVDMPLSNPAAAAAAATAPGVQPPTTAFQWEIRRALAATAEDIAAAGGAGCGQSPPGAGGSGPLAGLTGQLGGLGLAGGAAGASGSSGSTTPGGAAVPWAAHAALHRHLLMGLRRIQARFFQERLRKVHGLFGDAVDALLRQSLPQDVLVPEREVVVLVLVLLMLECRMRPEDFDSAFGRDLQRCLAVSTVDEVAARLRCGLVPDSALRIDPHKSRALSQLLKLGPLPGQASVF
ncbi:hypothetical protein HYH03_011974 [Edaphochlamys debaryana]|uniref:Uncharacterized protein n=1 Tax=Edaphochlamys debaryana TaxID=47281 RepID=A0A836BVX5_9CHLO|nr:hypothetical protein HYH03_011974 [Edaphochlamys debaryana]|eukprot:KAG2489523.1 hypothetical protein HYH03_011974 [Edaphochlamys debaryana]